MVAKSGWPCHRAEAGKFGTIKFYEIIVFRMFIGEGFQYFRRIIVGIFCFLIAKLGDALQILLGSACHKHTPLFKNL